VIQVPHITNRFSLGEIVATRGALSVLEKSGQSPLLFLVRHARGDWGEVGKEDWDANNEAVQNGGRLLSAYRTSLNERLWIITEWDRSVTTLLLPDEY
jgi:hypothetical protein